MYGLHGEQRMPDESCKAELCSKIASYISYTVASGLVAASELLRFMNDNAAACGVMLGILTYLTNIYFQRRVMECRCKILGVHGEHNEYNHPRRRVTDTEPEVHHD